MTNKYNVQILVDGKPIKEYTKDNNTFVEAKSGTEYSIRIKNNSNTRVSAAVSVDGINTITGEISKPSGNTGYIIYPYSSIEVKGYRQDEEGGGKFKFTEKESGYAKEIDGTGINSGVIGVLIVEEHVDIETDRCIWYNTTDFQPDTPPYKKPTWDPNKYSPTLSDTSNSFRCYYSASVNNTSTIQSKGFDQSTTWGSLFKEKVTYVDFKESNNTTLINIYYASRNSLKNMGVIKESVPQITLPRSFPVFAKPPATWNKN